MSESSNPSNPNIFAPRPLAKGQRVRLVPGGPVQTVLRVTSAAAYIGREVTKTFEVVDKVTGETKQVTKTETHADPISALAFVYPE